MIACQRHLFDIPDDIAYLNCAYMSPLMRPVTDAMATGVQAKVHPWTWFPQDFFTWPERARGLFARLVNGSADDVAIIPAASYGMAVAARALPLSAGESVVMLADQFPSNVYPWREKARAVGAAVTMLPRPADGDWTPALLAAIGPGTGIVALPHCHWTDGGLIDLVAVGARCREVGARLALDLTQSLGALPFDVQAVRPDAVVAAGYKWLMGPYTTGYLWLAPEWQDCEPLEHNWIGRKGSEDFARLVDYQDAYQPGARRFDVGERSNAALLMGSIAAMEQLLAWTPDAISETLGARTRAIAAQAGAMGLRSAPDHLRAPHFLGVRFPRGMPDGILDALKAKGVYLSARGDSLRITPHLYNTDADVARLFAALEAVV